MRCLHCGFDLSSSFSNSCPKCGAAIDPIDLESVVPTRRDQIKLFLEFFVPLAIMGLYVAAKALSVMRRRARRSP